MNPQRAREHGDSQGDLVEAQLQKAGQYSSAKVHRSLTVNSDGSTALVNLDGLAPEILDGF